MTLDINSLTDQPNIFQEPKLTANNNMGDKMEVGALMSIVLLTRSSETACYRQLPG
jgi:hypothetical protein